MVARPYRGSLCDRGAEELDLSPTPFGQIIRSFLGRVDLCLDQLVFENVSQKLLSSLLNLPPPPPVGSTSVLYTYQTGTADALRIYWVRLFFFYLLDNYL